MHWGTSRCIFTISFSFFPWRITDLMSIAVSGEAKWRWIQMQDFCTRYKLLLHQFNKKYRDKMDDRIYPKVQIVLVPFFFLISRISFKQWRWTHYLNIPGIWNDVRSLPDASLGSGCGDCGVYVLAVCVCGNGSPHWGRFRGRTLYAGWFLRFEIFWGEVVCVHGFS